MIIAFCLGSVAPVIDTALSAGLVGFCGYGLSLVLFVMALRELGAALTGAYFSVAPFAGSVIAFIMLGETPNMAFWGAAAMMGVGIWLHLTETHGHGRTHEEMVHSHARRHDAHHQHAHDFEWDTSKSHSHPHEHASLAHTHAHFPDIHHRHNNP